MATNQLKMGAEPASKMLHISNISHKMDNIQHNIGVTDLHAMKKVERCMVQMFVLCYSKIKFYKIITMLFFFLILVKVCAIIMFIFMNTSSRHIHNFPSHQISWTWFQ